MDIVLVEVEYEMDGTLTAWKREPKRGPEMTWKETWHEQKSPGTREWGPSLISVGSGLRAAADIIVLAFSAFRVFGSSVVAALASDHAERS